jgi:hypothetical protein
MSRSDRRRFAPTDNHRPEGRDVSHPRRGVKQSSTFGRDVEYPEGVRNNQKFQKKFKFFCFFEFFEFFEIFDVQKSLGIPEEKQV